MSSRRVLSIALFAALVSGSLGGCRSEATEQATGEAPAVDQAAVQPVSDQTSGAARVAQLSFVDGPVSVLEPGAEDWEDVSVNEPILAGYQVYAGDGAQG